MDFKTPYTPHIFGEEVKRRLSKGNGWLTAGVASSISWPSFDVCVNYAGTEYFLRGTEQNGKQSPPCITIPISKGGEDEAVNKIYRFTSILGWFLGGYVDVSGYVYGGHPVLYSSRNVFSSLGIAGSKSFSCNHMPIVEDDNVRKALAFWREGMRLDDVHDSYSFLSFYKVIESQFSDGRARGKWITENIEKLTDRAAKRVAELRAEGINVSDHLFESGRCAVAHASLNGGIVDPDIPSDRRRLSADLVIIQELARIYIRDVLKVPDSRSLYRTRDRLEPWSSLLPSTTIDMLKAGGTPKELSGLSGQTASIGLWPDGPINGLEQMSLHVDAIENGVVKLVFLNQRKTILLVFFLDYRSGRVHTHLEDGGLLYGEGNNPNETDVRAYSTFFYKVFSNGIAEITIEGHEPLECEVVIPTNMYMNVSAEQAIEEQVQKFREEEGRS